MEGLTVANQGTIRARTAPELQINASKAKTWACKSCQTRKIKCDGARPCCSTCIAHKRECHYSQPVISGPTGLESRGHMLDSRLGLNLNRNDLLSTRHELLSDSSRSVVSGASRSLVWPEANLAREPTEQIYFSPGSSENTASFDDNHRGQVDVTAHISLDRSGDIEVRGPTNTLYEANEAGLVQEQGVPDRYASAILTANAAMERQREASYREILLARGEIEGISAELVLHLLDIHWSRHHFFLLTYRPAFYRDMINGGPYYSRLLFFAMMAVSCRYSERVEVGGGDHSVDSGAFFYQKAKELLVDALETSSIPTATALLLLGNALVSAGRVDQGWLYTGMGIRMTINLGLHLDLNQTSSTRKKLTLEETEIRKRVFWGAFVCEKLQSLYLGRPIFMHEEDAHVPKIFLDMYEEEEPWYPFPDQKKLPLMQANSVSNFVAHCKLSEICEGIMSSFYAIKAKTRSNSKLHESRNIIRQRLSDWIDELPEKLRFTPWSNQGQQIVPIHVIILHTIYFSLVILLERPFVANGHLNSTAENIGSWVDCTIAAEKIAFLLQAYRNSYTFRRIPYQLCYATYVASTILVRNANHTANRSASLPYLGICLKAFEEMKLAHPGTRRMETVIRGLMARLSVNLDYYDLSTQETEIPSSSPIFLPSPNFNTSHSAIENRNIDIAEIQQSFAPRYQSKTVEGMQQTIDVGTNYVTAEAAASISQNLGGGSQATVTNFNWDFLGGNISDDLLFGILEENYN